MSLWLRLHPLYVGGVGNERELALSAESLINVEQAIAVTAGKKEGCFIVFDGGQYTHVRESLLEVQDLIEVNEFLVCLNCLRDARDHEQDTR